jgi:branched-chain amino acid transport system ATP-binding protein
MNTVLASRPHEEAAAAPAGSEALAVLDLEVHYRGIAALRGVSLAVQRGEIFALIGPNGAGKSSLVNAICGIVPSIGSIRFEGRELNRLAAHRRARQGVIQVPEGRRVIAPLTVLDNLKLGCEAAGGRGQDGEADAKRVFELFPILDERRHQLSGTLSGGQQQMLAIGRGLMARPEVLLLDEPQLGLAPLVIEAIARAIRRIHERGQTIVVVGQHAAMVVALASRIYVMEAGHVVVSGDTESVMRNGQIQNAYLGVA